MKSQLPVLTVLLTPVRLAFSLGLAAWWALEWLVFSAWHLILFIILPDRLQVPEQFSRMARRKLHEQGEAARFVWGM